MTNPHDNVTELRSEILTRLSNPPRNEASGYRCTPWGEAEELLDAYQDAYRAEVILKLKQARAEGQ